MEDSQTDFAKQNSTRLDLSWVTPQLAIGGRVPPEAIAQLQRLTIQHVVDLRAEDTDDERVLRRHGISFLRLPMLDGQACPLALIQRGVDWVRPRLEENNKVLIHCEYGIGRSPLLACCALVSVEVDPIDAIRQIKDARSQASPSREQLAVIVEWTRAWRETTAVPWLLPSVDELARIAHRHLASY